MRNLRISIYYISTTNEDLNTDDDLNHSQGNFQFRKASQQDAHFVQTLRLVLNPILGDGERGGNGVGDQEMDN